MKKKNFIIPLICVISLFFTSTALAMSSIIVQNATPVEMKSYLIKYISALGENTNIENMSDTGITFDITRTKFNFIATLFFKDASNKITFTFTPEGEGTLLTYNAIARAHDYNGQETIVPTSTPETERQFLEEIKFNFDGGYIYGFSLFGEKKDDGFPIAVISPGSPAEAAGLQLGDVVTKVNGKKLKYDKKSNTYNFYKTIQAPIEMYVTIKRNKTEKIVHIKSAFYNVKTQHFQKDHG